MKQTRHLLIALALGTMLTSCGASVSTATVTGPAAYVDPYIGSGGHGHVFVGASVPFGAIQAGPQNIHKGWDWCSGYHHSDSIVIGFAHTHLSGTAAPTWATCRSCPTRRAALQTRPAGGHRRKLFILLQPRQRIRIAGLLFAQNGQRRADRDDCFDPHGAAPHHLPRSGRPPPAHQPRRGQRRRSVRHLSQADGCAHRRRLPLLQRLGSPQGFLRADY